MSQNSENDNNSKKRTNKDNDPTKIDIVFNKKKTKILRFSKGTPRRDCIGKDCKIQVKINFTLCGSCFNKRIRKCCEKCKKELLNDDVDENKRTSYDKHVEKCNL